MKKILRYRVYPESPHGFYFDVSIYPTKERMQAAAARGSGRTGKFSGASAITCGYREGAVVPNGRINWTKTCGHLFFHLDALGTEVITHESTHAAIRWAEEKGIRLPIIGSALKVDRGGDACENEERFCYAVGNIASQLASKNLDLGLYDDVLK